LAETTPQQFLRGDSERCQSVGTGGALVHIGVPTNVLSLERRFETRCVERILLQKRLFSSDYGKRG
jgi:hypothetical protein